MTGDDLFDYAKKVNSREDFIRFVTHLNIDHRQNHAEWENQTLEQYLSGLASFANDMKGYYVNMNETIDIDQITWRMAAEMLLAASVYGD